MDTQKRLHEHISALVDGELADSELELAFAALGTADGHTTWNAYHQIGHTLRSDHFGAELSAAFSSRLAALLDAEPAMQPAPARRKTEPAADGGGASPVTTTLG